MSRPIPGAFLNQDTYGISTNKDRDRLPVVQQTDVASIQAVLLGERDIPVRFCLAAMPHAGDETDIARLVIGAIVSASGVSSTAAKLNNPWPGGYTKNFIEWANKKAMEVASSVPAPATEGATSISSESFPREVLPTWLRDLDFTDEAVIEAWNTSSLELAAYAGILAFAVGKQPTPENIEAYNLKRRNAISQYMTQGNLRIFVDDSPHLSFDMLIKVHRAFNTPIIDRALLFSAVVDHDHALISGKERSFYTIFRLGAGSSLNPLLIVTRFARKYPHLYGEFKDLETEYHAAAHALQRFYDAPEKRRMYLKLIFGNSYIPVDRADVDNLLGVAVFALQQTETTLSNYNGGTLSVIHRERLLKLLEVKTEKSEEIAESE